MALEEKGDLKAACREYRLVDRDSEQFVPAWLRLAYLHYQLGEKDQARRVLEDLRTLAPHREEIYLTESYFFEEENLWDRAIKALQAGLSKVDRPAEIYYRLAVLYEKTNNREESIKNIKKVLELDPETRRQNFELFYARQYAWKAKELIKAACGNPTAAISSTA
jgi:tetratricopeptide (TPR) repeat protein